MSEPIVDSSYPDIESIAASYQRWFNELESDGVIKSGSITYDLAENPPEKMREGCFVLHFRLWPKET